MERLQGLLDYLACVSEHIKQLEESRKSFEREGRRCSESVLSEEKDLRDVLIEVKIKIALRKASKESSKKATDARYNITRLLLDKAANVAKLKWEGGSTLLHHQMKKYLVEGYQDQNGKYPFLILTEKSLLETCKQVAKDMNRLDLISGQKKSK